MSCTFSFFFYQQLKPKNASNQRRNYSSEKMQRVKSEMRSSLGIEVFQKKRASATLQHGKKFELPARILGNTSGVSFLEILGEKL